MRDSKDRACIPRERPILFNGAMVRAILAGQKTQTRRVVKRRRGWPIEFVGGMGDFNDPSCWGFECSETAAWWLLKDDGDPGSHQIPCPFGEPGDRLWVRETWGVVSNAWDDDGNICEWNPDRDNKEIHELPFGNGYYSGHVIYAADGAYEWAGDDDGGGEPRSAWHPSIHMPRAASRITLEITGVRVERLHDISEDDCWAEGIEAVDGALDDVKIIEMANRMGRSFEDAAPTFAALLGSTGAVWAENPWVWVIEFKLVTP